MSSSYLAFFAFLAAVLVALPIPWHWRARNIPTLSIMGWLLVTNLIYGVNVIVWSGNVLDPIPIWCDITNRIRIGSQLAIPASIMCVCRALEAIAANRVVHIDRKTRQRWMIFDFVMCFILPLVFMALQYIVAGHRYDIIEELGCQPYTYQSIAGIFIVYFPPLLCSIVAMVLAAMAFYHFFRHRINFTAHLQAANPALTARRYFRLMGMALVVIFWNTSLNAVNMVVNVSTGLRPWISWENVHSDWLRVDLYPLALLPPQFVTSLYVYWFAIPISSYIVFIFFGLGEEAQKEYKRVWAWFRRVVLRRRDLPKGTTSLPVYAPRYPSKATSSFNSAFEPSKDSGMSTHMSSSTLALPDKVGNVYAMHDLPVLSHSPTTPTDLSTSPSSTRFSLSSVAHAHIMPPPGVAAPRPFSFPSASPTETYISDASRFSHHA
ncbi:STE3-domain-containing protein [Peniophora sp. CONT]|nr:STE3-domain-containing protein [Peniophora sp. CONT]